MNKRTIRIAIHAAELLISILREILDWLEIVESESEPENA